MGRKPQRHSWPEAKKLCRLNHNDIAMAKRLGFGPDALIRCRPGPRQRWKLPVKYWVRELHLERFGHIIGEKPLPPPTPAELEYDEEAARIYGEELYLGRLLGPESGRRSAVEECRDQAQGNGNGEG